MGIVILWTTIILGMSRTGLKLVDSRPISYLGVDPMSATLFSVGLIVSAVLFTIFGLYVRKNFAVKNRFLMYLLIGQAGQIITAISPYGMQSEYKLIHTIAAFTLALSLPPLIRSFAHSQTHDSHSKIYDGLYRFELVTFFIGMGLFIFTKGIAPIGEALPAIGFHVWIIVITIIAYKKLATASA